MEKVKKEKIEIFSKNIFTLLFTLNTVKHNKNKFDLFLHNCCESGSNEKMHGTGKK